MKVDLEKESDASEEEAGRQTEEKPSGQMFFELDQGELSNALQFLCMSPRIGRLEVQFEDGDTAQLYLADQTVVHVVADDAQGTQAMASIIRHTGKRRAVFYEGEEPPEKSSAQPLSQFLLEASVMADELSA